MSKKKNKDPFLVREDRNLSGRVVEFSDIERMRKYKMSLIDCVTYPNPDILKIMSKNLYIATLFEEIKKIEVWIKKASAEFVNNNLRSFEQ